MGCTNTFVQAVYSRYECILNNLSLIDNAGDFLRKPIFDFLCAITEVDQYLKYVLQLCKIWYFYLENVQFDHFSVPIYKTIRNESILEFCEKIALLIIAQCDGLAGVKAITWCNGKERELFAKFPTPFISYREF